MRALERRGARVLNGADVFALELSKSAQATLLHRSASTPRARSCSTTSPRCDRSRATIRWPALLKPDQGGSGARIQVVESLAQVEAIFAARSRLWLPDNLFLLQEYLPHDPDQGIVRLEFLGGELLYAMRVKTHGRFNLCPSPVCNPEDGDGAARSRHRGGAPPVEFYPYPEVPARRGGDGARRIVRARRASTSAASSTWRPPTAAGCFYDINANSNLRPSVAAAFGFDPFERVVDFLEHQLALRTHIAVPQGN